MIEPEAKTILENDLILNLSTVNIKVPPLNTTLVPMKMELAHSVQDVLDKMLSNEENIAHLVVSYPTSDLEFVPFAYNDAGLADEANKIAEQLFAVGDWVTVDGVTTAVITFQSAEPYLYRLALYTKLPAGSTSWLWVELKDNLGRTLAKRLVYATAHNSTGSWIIIPLKFSVTVNPVTGLSELMTITISENTFGANPIGVDIGKNGANIAYRLYNVKKVRLTGKIAREVVRLNVFCKEKKAGQDPSKASYISKSDMISQLCSAVRKRIWAAWPDYGLNDMGPTVMTDDETDSGVPYASGVIDAFVEIPDFGTTPVAVDTFKQLDIDSIERV
jgi:hypothetical protein